MERATRKSLSVLWILTADGRLMEDGFWPNSIDAVAAALRIPTENPNYVGAFVTDENWTPVR